MKINQAITLRLLLSLCLYPASSIAVGMTERDSVDFNGIQGTVRNVSARGAAYASKELIKEHRSETFKGKGYAHGRFKHFEVEPSDIESSPVVIEITTEQRLRVRVTSLGAVVSLAPNPGSENVVFKGLKPNKEYHVYKDGFNDHSTVQTDVSGTAIVSVDTTKGSSVFVQEEPSTYHLSTPSGEDCSIIGTWDSELSKCTLLTDVFDTISIDSVGLTLDCADHSVEANKLADIALSADAATVQNCRAGHATLWTAIYASGTGGHRILNNTLGSLANPGVDTILFEFGSGNNVIKNNIIDTTLGALVAHSDGPGYLVENNEFRGVDGAFGTNLASGAGHHVFLNNKWDMQGPGARAIYIVDSEGGNSLIKGNTFTNGQGVFIFSSQESDSNNVVEGNDFYVSSTGVLMQGWAPGGPGTGSTIAGDNNQILNNKIDSAARSGISVNSGHTNMKIIGNTISNSGTGIYFDVEMDDMLVEDNVISNVGHGISSNSGFTFAGNRNRFAGNTIRNADESSITLVKENDAVIENNIITDSAGIMIGNSNGVTLRNNRISRGIQSSRSKLATGDGCKYKMVIPANFDAGIVIKGSPNTWIDGNTIDSSYGVGIRVEPLVREILDVPEDRMNANPGPDPDDVGCLWSPRRFQNPPFLTGTFQTIVSSNTVILKNVIRKNRLGGMSLESASDSVVALNDVFLNAGFAVSSDAAIELSDAGRGNWWHGNCSKGLFVAGFDSNAEDVVDSFPYRGSVSHVPIIYDPDPC
jgi:hypothetical protein